MIFTVLAITFSIMLLALVWLLLTKKPMVFTSLLLSFFAIYKIGLWQFHLSHIPDGMGVWYISYANEKSWGWGPGGNETGLIEYSLPKKSAQKAIANGKDYLNHLPRNKKCYGEWQETPIRYIPRKNNAYWFNLEKDQKLQTPNIKNYLYRYGFQIAFDKKILASVNKATSTTGSFFQYCRGGGVTIVMPHAQKIVFAYSG